MSEMDCSRAPRSGAVSGSPLVVSRYQRQPLHWTLVDELGSIGDIRINLLNGDVDSALRLRRRFEQAVWLLDDLGWDQHTQQHSFELTMPTHELRPYLEKTYWNSIRSLTEHPHELIEQAKEHHQTLTQICPTLLTQIAETTSHGGPTVPDEDASELLVKLRGLIERLEGQMGVDD